MTKSNQAFRTISEVSTELDVPAHVLRFWETKFPQIKPMKRGGGRRYYRPEDISLLKGVQSMLHVDGYSIKGVQKALREQGVKAISDRDDSPAVVSIDSGKAATAKTDAAAPALSSTERAELRGVLDALVALRADLTGEATRKSA
jgi:DNA-binding transcriptional MerR regulator